MRRYSRPVPLPLVIAHRGDSSGATANSLEAFERAIAGGVDMIEFDVRRTKDGQLVVHHDATVAGIPLAAMTSVELSDRAPHPPPLLDEVLELAHGRCGLDVELKEDGYVAEVLRSVLAHAAPEQVLVTSFLDAVVLQVKERAPDVEAALLLGRGRPPNLMRTRMGELLSTGRLARCRADYAAPHHRLAELGALRRADRAGLRSLVWTVNDDDAIRRFLADDRVHAVITDVPHRALALRDELLGRRLGDDARR